MLEQPFVQFRMSHNSFISLYYDMCIYTVTSVRWSVWLLEGCNTFSLLVQLTLPLVIIMIILSNHLINTHHMNCLVTTKSYFYLISVTIVMRSR